MPGAPFILCVVLIIMSCRVTAQAQAGLAPAAVFPYSEGAVSGLAREFLLFHCCSGLIGRLTSWVPLRTHPVTGDLTNQSTDGVWSARGLTGMHTGEVTVLDLGV